MANRGESDSAMVGSGGAIFNNMDSYSRGTYLDSMAAQIDSLSSTQLYALIVGLTMVVSFVLLGCGGNTATTMTGEMAWTEQERAMEMKRKKRKATGPEPRWHIFRWVNYGIVAAFAWSVAEFGFNASSYSSDSTVLLRFLFAWSIFLCYFFGFFGVSFVHDINAEDSSASSTGTDELDDVAVTKVLNENKVHSSSYRGQGMDKIPRSIETTKATTSLKQVHPPAYSAPVCSDPASLKASYKSPEGIRELADEQVANLVLVNQIKDHELEKRLDPHRAVTVRRKVVEAKLSNLGLPGSLQKLPSSPSLDYSKVHGANCEIVVGYVPLPVGLVGPLTLNGESVYVPMATTEGCLVASTNRGAKAISSGSGAHAVIVRDGITRAPCVRMASAMKAAELKVWCEEPENFAVLKAAFESTTSFGKLKSCAPTVAGRNVYLRLTCFSGDAMGMNMVSKGSLAVIETLQKRFPSLQLVALSGNMCTDKKAAATNWLEGRGKSVVVEATISKEVVRSTLKTTVRAMVETNLHKNLIGSAMAGVIGGFNAHASNIVTAVFLATGQDPAQNVESSNCITLLEETEEGDLWISCTMPSLEVGTVGGGTSLEAQSACLQAVGCKGGGSVPGENARKLAMVIASATMAGELSLLAALAANTLVQAHMQHNRKKKTASS